MPEIFEKLRVFISSASDVADERELTKDVIDRINNSVANTLKIHLEEVKWEYFSPLTKLNQSIQSRINIEVDSCEIFVLILFRRYGTIPKSRSNSNLEFEVKRALKKLREGGDLIFLTYFKNLPDNVDPGEQEQRVLDFRNRLRKANVWFGTFETSRDFEIKLTHDLYRSITRYRLESKKLELLENFWSLGETDRGHLRPRLTIVYPPVSSLHQNFSRNEKYWHSRLVPNVIFEDYKVIQKIEKNLRVIGFRNFKIESALSLVANSIEENCIWICIPRNRRSQDRLKVYQKQLKFKIDRKQDDTTLMWKNRHRKSFFQIKSPLSTYLRLQREATVNWSPRMENIIAKDYAVLARFNKTNANTSRGILKEFFIAGIRGLGTWGVGWYIDRKYSDFSTISPHEEFQILLEITYMQGRIKDVVDVSDKPPKYFHDQFSENTIQQEIEKFKMSYMYS